MRWTRIGSLRGRHEPRCRRALRRSPSHYGHVVAARGLHDRDLSPRFVMLHTFAHLLINELVYECGYSSASLRERLYVLGRRAEKWPGSSSIQPPAILKARWGDLSGWLNPTTCGPSSPRPSVMLGGVRPTLSAWTLVKGAKGRIRATSRPAMGALCLPETSCEEFNRFLDRGLVVGSLSDTISAILET